MSAYFPSYEAPNVPPKRFTLLTITAMRSKWDEKTSVGWLFLYDSAGGDLFDILLREIITSKRTVSEVQVKKWF